MRKNDLWNLACHLKVILIALATLIFYIYTFNVYTERVLEGNKDNYILASDRFGVPEALKARGVQTLYHNKTESGWDGQFYYYMSNDLLGLKDTPEHIDAPSYRYQRIGMSLYAACFSKLLGMDWVSPKIYLISYFLLVFLALIVGGYLFQRLGGSSALILFWGLSVGTQFTMFNALPDAAADAFLILALSAVYSKRYFLSVIPFIFSALSREVYALFPSLIFLFLLWGTLPKYAEIFRGGISSLISHLVHVRSFYWLLFPGVVAVLWRTYVVLHFGVEPAEQAHGILGFPLLAWWDYVLSGFSGNHLLVGPGFSAYAESISLTLFLVVLFLVFFVSYMTLKSSQKSVSADAEGVSASALLLAALYACFGATVIMHYTGYFKAIAVFFFVVPYILQFSHINNKIKYIIYFVLSLSILFTNYYNLKTRVFLDDSRMNSYTKTSFVTKFDRVECFGEYSAEIQVKKISIKKRSYIERLTGAEDLILMDLTVENTGNNTFISTNNFGSVNVSYHWVDSEGRVAMDGVRSAILQEVQPGEDFNVTIVSKFPKSISASLIPSLVQEGCAWFYMANPTEAKSPVVSVTR